MRIPRLPHTILVFLTFFCGHIFSQDFAPVLSQDSLKGFNENIVKKIAKSEGITGAAYARLLEEKKRDYVNTKYNLYSQYYNPTVNFANSGFKPIGGNGNSINAAPCVNEGFEAGTTTGWVGQSGLNNVTPAGSCTPAATAGTSPILNVVTLPFNDAVIGTIPTSPFSGNKAVRLNDALSNSGVTRILQTFPVTTSNFLYEFSYMSIMSTLHPCCEQPYMQVRLLNLLGAPVPCQQFTFAPPPPSGPVCASAGIAWSFTTLGSASVAYNPTWQRYSIDLTGFITSTVTIEVTVADCIWGGHFGYAYFDSNCNELGFTLNGTTFVSAPTQTINLSGQCAQTASISAPGGLGPYSWTGPSGTSTNQVLVTNLAGTYTISMNPPGSCLPVTRVINLAFPPPTTITASPANLCTSGTNTTSTLSATGASQYTWSPGGSTLSTIAVSPTVTTIYTLTARTGTCVGDYTIQVTVNPDPPVTAVSSNTSVCPGQSAQLTAFGATSYIWNPGGLTGSMVTVSPAVPTTYTVIGTSTAACSNSATVSVGIDSPPPVVIFPNSSLLICSGGTVQLIAVGANTITWFPGAIVGPIQTFTPSASTTYTAIGASGTCTNSATINVTVNPGPSMTLSANPAVVCPGNSSTLSVVAPSAVGAFTWNPGAITGTSIVVTPTIAGGYSVSAVDVMGCRNTQTINPNISPLPSITISPTSPSVCMGSSVTLTASGALNYTWMPGNLNGSSISVSPSSNTTYTVTGANAAGCTGQNTVLVIVNPTPTINLSASPPSFCAGSCFTLTPSGAGVGGTYIISPATFCPLINTTYTVIGTSSAGCSSAPALITVTVNNGPAMFVTASPATICAGASSTLTPSGAISYTWDNGSTTVPRIVTPSITTTYTVTGANGFGCTTTTTVMVTVNPIPVVVINPPAPTICAGSSVTLSATGAPSFTWNPGGLTGTSIVVSPPSNTTYTAVGSSGGCTGQNTVLVTVTPIPIINASFSPPSVCAGSCATLTPTGALTYTYSTGSPIVCPAVTTTVSVTGSNGACVSNPVVVTLTVNSGPLISAAASPTSVCAGSSSTLTASGGASSYTWLPMGIVATSVIVNPATTTTYSLVGSNGLGCTTTTTVMVVVTPPPGMFALSTPPSICSGATATLTVSGATNYTWMPGALTGSMVFVTPTISTTYTVFGSSGACTGSTVAFVSVTTTPTVNITASALSICAGTSVTLTASGASTYNWSTGSAATVIIVSPSVTTTYSLSGFNGPCNSNIASVTITVTPSPAFTVTASPPGICTGGSSTLSLTGATAYTLLPLGLTSTGSPFIVTPATNTTYTIIGSNGTSCVATRTITVTVSPGVNVTAIATPSTICSGGASFLSAFAIGAIGFTWSPGGLTGANVTVSPPVTTTYTVVATNLSGCTGQATVTVNVLPAPTVSISPSATLVCVGSCATLTALGATSYTWSTGSVGPTAIVCPSLSTSYTVLGSSGGGCLGSASILIPVSFPPFVTASANSPSICAGGSSTLTANGAVNYVWMPGSLSGPGVVVNPSSTTIYTVTGTNSSGCSGTATTMVTVSPNPIIFASATPGGICQGQSSTLTASGATSFTWSPGGMTGSPVIVTPPVTTIYTVTGTQNGCNGMAATIVTVSPIPVITASASPSVMCGSIITTLTASGASSYVWSPSGLTGSVAVVIPVVSTTYTVTGTNAFGCSGTATTNVTVVTPPSVSITSNGSNTICSGSSITLMGAGATTYTWSTGSQFSSITVSPSVTTVYSVIGASGSCTGSATFTVFVNSGSALAINASTTTVCSGFTVALLATGGTSYTWTPGGSTSNPLIITPTISGSYVVNGISGGCAAGATVNITVIPLPNVNVSANPPVICTGNSTTLTATGAATYSWIPSLVGGSVFIDAPPITTNYTVVGFNSFGCPNYDTVTVVVLPPPSVAIIASSASVCVGNSATLTANGATNYTWQPGGQTGAVLVVNPSSPTTYTAVGANGTCTNSATISIGIHPLPSIVAFAANSPLCAGNTVTLSASGALNYTWNPTGLIGTPVTDNPVTSTTYTVTGEDANGCTNTASVPVAVNNNPIVTAAASQQNICSGSSVTLTASGANNYTWSPSGLTTVSIVDTPTGTGTIIYGVLGVDGNGCFGSATVGVNVIPNPTLSVTPLNSSVCIGSSATLTASGASNYTWLPSGTQSSVTIENPVVMTTYTVIGSNGGLCFSSFTVNVFVNPLPANVSATSIGTVSCASPTVQLLGSSTDTNVSYFWLGPQNYSATGQNTIVSGIWGTFTLNVVDNITGCIGSAFVNVPTDNSIPLVTTMTSGSITCNEHSVTISAVHTTTNPGYSWVGPGGFTSTLQAPTTTVSGNYTITVTDLTSGCTGSAIATVGSHTNVTITASLTAPTCTDGVSNNDGKITLFGFGSFDKYDLVSGPTYTGSATYTSAALIPTAGIITSNLANPSTTVAFTVRIFDSYGCVKDTVLYLVPVDCSLKTLGLAKAVSEPILNPDGSYNVTYTVIVRNYDTSKIKGSLKDVKLTENLSATFPNATTFTLVSPPVISSGSSLTLNPGFDGVSQTDLTTPSLSVLEANATDTITFTLKVKTSLFFVPFKNSVIGEGVNSASLTIRDSSNTGLNPDPDSNGNPYDNNIPTVIIFIPNTFFGITKIGEIHKTDDNSYDISYTVTVHNLGNDTLRNVTLKDSLLGKTIQNPATYSMRSAPVSNGSGLVPNPLYNGNTDINLVIAEESKMLPGTSRSISFVINVVPGTVTMFSNSAYGNAQAAASATESIIVSDTSNTGNDPDVNGNGVWNEGIDNMPTVLLVPNTSTLFIPEGFSPNSDNVNDLFVIKGLPTNGENTITIFNRWGNKVYSHANYDNSWDGTPNVSGTFGKNKLPEGTYYYILDMKGSGIKPITGFVALQYEQ